MPTQCIFCDNNSGSREHLWPAWMHAIKDFGPIKMIRKGQEVVVIPDPELKVKTVCGVCNNGWMSELEAENIPVFGDMLEDRPIELNENLQALVAAWGVKTTMMSDSMKGRNAANKFYTRHECTKMREMGTIPERTLIWIGRVDGMHLANVGNDFTLNCETGQRQATNIATTIVAGHFVIQVVSIHLENGSNLDNIPCKQGDWNDRLIQIWPIQKPVVHWPPKGSFTNGGPDGIAYLMDRWRLGEEKDIIEPIKPATFKRVRRLKRLVAAVAFIGAAVGGIATFRQNIIDLLDIKPKSRLVLLATPRDGIGNDAFLVKPADSTITILDERFIFPRFVQIDSPVIDIHEAERDIDFSGAGSLIVQSLSTGRIEAIKHVDKSHPSKFCELTIPIVVVTNFIDRESVRQTVTGLYSLGVHYYEQYIPPSNFQAQTTLKRMVFERQIGNGATPESEGVTTEMINASARCNATNLF